MDQPPAAAEEKPAVPEEQTDAARVGARAELEDELHAKLDELESRLSVRPEREVAAEIDSLATRVAALQTAFEADRATTSSMEHVEVERLASALEPLERRVTELEQAPNPKTEPAVAEAVTAAVASLRMRLEALEASSRTSEQALLATEQALKAREQERAVDLEAARARNEAARADREELAELKTRLTQLEARETAPPMQAAVGSSRDELIALGQRLDQVEARLTELASSPTPAPAPSGPPTAGGAAGAAEVADLRRRFDAFEQRFPQHSKVVPLPLPPRELKVATRLRVLLVAGLVALIVLLPLTFISRSTCRQGGGDQTRWSIALPGADPPSGCQKRESGFELIVPG